MPPKTEETTTLDGRWRLLTGSPEGKTVSTVRRINTGLLELAKAQYGESVIPNHILRITMPYETMWDDDKSSEGYSIEPHQTEAEARAFHAQKVKELYG